jgi:hypothetical protein
MVNVIQLPLLISIKVFTIQHYQFIRTQQRLLTLDLTLVIQLIMKSIHPINQYENIKNQFIE